MYEFKSSSHPIAPSLEPSSKKGYFNFDITLAIMIQPLWIEVLRPSRAINIRAIVNLKSRKT